jgi:hypothetical protein
MYKKANIIKEKIWNYKIKNTKIIIWLKNRKMDKNNTIKLVKIK